MDGILLPKRSIGYRHIPKTAGTSIKLALYRLRTGKSFVREKVGMDVYQYFRKRYTDISDAKFKFIVIRDPIKRFLSAYSNRVTHHKELSKTFLEKTKNGKRLLAKSKIPVDPSLSDFIKYLNDYETMPSIKNHIKPVTEIFNEELEYFDKVYKIEETKKLEEDISERYKAEFILPRAQTGGKKFNVAALSKDEIDFLLEYYTKDYELMKNYYSKEKVLEEWALGKGDN